MKCYWTYIFEGKVSISRSIACLISNHFFVVWSLLLSSVSSCCYCIVSSLLFIFFWYICWLSSLDYVLSGDCVQLVAFLFFFFFFVSINLFLIVNTFTLFFKLILLGYTSGCFNEDFNSCICFFFCFKAYHPYIS